MKITQFEKSILTLLDQGCRIRMETPKEKKKFSLVGEEGVKMTHWVIHYPVFDFLYSNGLIVEHSHTKKRVDYKLSKKGKLILNSKE